MQYTRGNHEGYAKRNGKRADIFQAMINGKHQGYLVELFISPGDFDGGAIYMKTLWCAVSLSRVHASAEVRRVSGGLILLGSL